jgi:hypothetical protein
MRRARSCSDFAEDAPGVSDSDDVGWDVAGNDRAGADDAVVADSDAGADDYTPAEPHVVADGDRFGRLQLVASRRRFDLVGWGQQLDVRSELAVGADGDGGDVESGEVVLMNVRAPMAMCSP